MDEQLAIFSFEVVLFREISEQNLKLLAIRILSIRNVKSKRHLKRENLRFDITLFDLLVIFWK